MLELKDKPVPSTTPNFRGNSMYAIAFDLDGEALTLAYPGFSPNNAYTEIRKVLEEKGFKWTQRSVYFGGEEINSVAVHLAIMDLHRRFVWFKPAVRDLKMLRIEEDNDLKVFLDAL